MPMALSRAQLHGVRRQTVVSRTLSSAPTSLPWSVWKNRTSRHVLTPPSAARDPRDRRAANIDDYGSEEVPESWQDEWMSGNKHIEEDRAKVPFNEMHETASYEMAARSGVDVSTALGQSLSEGLGSRDAAAIDVTRQAAQEVHGSSAGNAGSGSFSQEGVGEGAGVQDIE